MLSFLPSIESIVLPKYDCPITDIFRMSNTVKDNLKAGTYKMNIFIDFPVSIRKGLQKFTPYPDNYIKTISLELVDDVRPNLIVKDLTINEGVKYSVNDFVKEVSDNSSGGVSVFYKESKMGNYVSPGKYSITIIAKDKSGNITEKVSTLQINTVKKVSTKNVNSSNNTNSTQSFLDKVKTDNKKLGDSGRLYLSKSYSVALYYGPYQDIVDRTDSAAIWEHKYSITVIADHAYQGFSYIKGVKVGDIAYIKTKDKIIKYKAVEKTIGTNTGPDLITKDGRSIYSDDAKYSLVMYTCNSPNNSKDITLVFWQEVK